MMKYLFGCLWACLLSLPTYAQFGKSLFWEVAGKGKTRLYILGTHHLYPNEFVKKSVPIQTALKKSKVVAGEILLDNQMAMAMKMLKYIYMPNTSLKKLLTADDYKQLETYMSEQMKMPIAMFNTMKPIVLYNAIIAQKYKQDGEAGGNPMEMNADLSKSIDGYIQLEARNQKKDVRGLEEVEDQAEALFNGYTLEKQVEMLMAAVKDTSTALHEELKRTNALYASQDVEGMADLTQKSMSKEEIKRLLTNRNLKWIPQLEKLLAGKKSAFIAVGAGHLAGEDGVLTLLKAHGYTVTPVPIVLE